MTNIYIYVLGNENLQQAIDSLPEWRRRQALRFRHRQGQAECAMSYLLLCHALKQEYGIGDKVAFLVDAHGKPSLAQYPDIHFNMSHCKLAVAVAVADQPVGIDIERTGRYSASVARYAFDDEELAALEAADNPQALFTRLWTQKEAVAKLTGRGITDEMKTLLADTDADIETRELEEFGCTVSVAQHRQSEREFHIIRRLPQS